MTRIWSVPVPESASFWSGFRQLLTYRLRAFVMLIGLGVAVVLVFASGWTFTAFQCRIAARFHTSPWVWRSLDIFLQVALNALVFAALYRFLPKRPISWRQAWVGGLFAAIVWELGRQLLAQFIIGQRYTSAYGIIGTLLAIMIWGYYGIAVVLVGAQLVSLLVEQGWLVAANRGATGNTAMGTPPSVGNSGAVLRPQRVGDPARAAGPVAAAVPVGMAAQMVSAAGVPNIAASEEMTAPVRVRRPLLKRLGGRSPDAPRRLLPWGWIPELGFAMILLYFGSFLAMRHWGARQPQPDVAVPAVRTVIFSRHPATHRIIRAAYTPLIEILPGAYEYPVETTETMTASYAEEIADASMQ